MKAHILLPWAIVCGVGVASGTNYRESHLEGRGQALHQPPGSAGDFATNAVQDTWEEEGWFEQSLQEEESKQQDLGVKKSPNVAMGRHGRHSHGQSNRKHPSIGDRGDLLTDIGSSQHKESTPAQENEEEPKGPVFTRTMNIREENSIVPTAAPTFSPTFDEFDDYDLGPLDDVPLGPLKDDADDLPTRKVKTAERSQRKKVTTTDNDSNNNDDDGDTTDHRMLVLAGVCLCLVSCLMSSAGYTLQKHSRIMGEGDLPLLRQWRYWLGVTALVLTAGLLDAVVLAICPLSLIAPITGVTLATNDIFGAMCLGESMQYIVLPAIAVIVFGIAITSAFGQHRSDNYNGDQIMDLFREWYILPYYLTLGVIVVTSIVVIFCFSTSSKKGKDEKQSAANDKHVLWQAIGFANIAGLLQALQSTYLKCCMEMVEDMIRHGSERNEFGRAPIFVLFLAFLVAGVMQLMVLNEGFGKYRQEFYMPIYQAIVMVYGIAAGGIFFQEFGDLSTTSAILFPVGVCTVIVGLALFSTKKPPKADDENPA